MRVHLTKIDTTISGWMEKYGIRILRICLALIFIWFGLLKPWGLSPEEQLISHTVYWFDPNMMVPFIGCWEVITGLCLLYRPFIRFAGIMLLLQMPGTLLPLFLLPEVCFTSIPFGLTMEGQYIVKNLILITAALVVGGTVRTQSCENRKL